MLRRCGWIFFALLWCLAGVRAPAFSGLRVTNNAELARSPSAFWSRTIVFEEEFQSVAANPVKLSRGWCYPVQGKEVTFYVPQNLVAVVQSLLPGDRIEVGAVIQNERSGLTIFTLHLEALSFTVRATADGPGRVNPLGPIPVNRGDRLPIDIHADEHCHIDEVRVDGQPSGEAGPGVTAVTHVFENIGASHILEIRFVRDQYLLSVDSERGMVSPIAGRYPFEHGREVILRIDQPEVEGSMPGERHVCVGWTGTGDAPEKGRGSEARFNITQDSSLKWLWATEYELAVSAVEGGRVRGTTGWMKEGAEAKLTAVPEADYLFTGWDGDVPEELFKANPLPLLMDRPRTVIAHFHRDLVEVEARAGEHGTIEPAGTRPVVRGKDLFFKIAADPDYHIARLLVDGEPVEGRFGPGVVALDYTLPTPSQSHRLEAEFAPDPRALTIRSAHQGVRPEAGAHTYPHGERIEIRGADLPVDGETPGVRYVNTGWTGGGDVPETGEGAVIRFAITRPSFVEWTWTKQFLLQASAGWGGQVEARTGWYAEGERVSILAEPSEGRKFAGWSGDVPPGLEKDNPLFLDMDQPRTISALFDEDIFVIRATKEGNGSVEPSGDVTVPKGRNAAFSVTAAPYHHIDQLLVDGKAVGRFGQGSNAVTFTFVEVTNAHTFEAFFSSDEYELRVESRHRDVTPAPGRHRLQAGMEWTARVNVPVVQESTPGQRLVVRGWTGTGDVPPQGDGDSASFVVTQNSTLNWLWAHEFHLQAEAGEGGSLEGESGWHREQTRVRLSAHPDKGYRFTGWQGDVIRSEAGKPHLTWLMDRPRSLRAMFEKDLVAVRATAGEEGSIVPSGEIPVERNESIGFSIRANPRHHIARLLIDGRTTGTFGSGSNTLLYTFSNVTNYRTIEVAFAPNTYTLTVESEAATVTPQVGRHEIAEDTVVTASAESPADGTRPGERLVCVGWTGTGNVPGQGKQLSTSFRLTRDSSLRWLWVREFEIQASAGPGGSIKGTTGWLAEQGAAILQATPADGYVLAGWQGLEPGMDTRDPLLRLTVKQPLALTAVFTQDLLYVTTTAGENGSIEPDGQTAVMRGGDQPVTIRADTGYHIDQVLLDGRPIGPFGRGSNFYTHVFSGVDRDRRLAAFFSPDTFFLEIESAQPSGVEPGPGRFEYPAGTVIRAGAPSLSPDKDFENVRHVCVGWTGSGNVPESGTRSSVEFNLTRDSRLTWLWEPEFQLSINADAGGRVKGESGWYRRGTVVVAQALPHSKYNFTKWSGDIDLETEKQNPLSVVMDQPRSLTAHFAREQGRLSILPEPEIAAWSLTECPADYTGPRTGVGPLDNQPAPAGAYTVRFEPLEGYRPPDDKSLNLKTGGAASFRGAYDPIPGLQVSINRIERTVTAGQGLSNQVFQVWNAGPGELKFAISRNVSWLWITPKVGASSGERHDIRVDFNTHKLPPGEHEGRITVAVRNADALPRDIPVLIRVVQEEVEAPVEPTASAEPANSLQRGLVAYYALNGNAHDGSAYSNHGLLHGAPSFVNHPPFGQAGVFDRRGERYVEIPHRDHLVLSNSFTIQFWYKPGARTGRIVQKLWPARRSSNREWEISLRDDFRMVFKYADPDHASAFEFLCPIDCGWAQGAWNCFAFAYSAPENRMYGYLNGIAVTNQSPKGQVVPLDSPLPLYLMNDRYKADGDMRFDAEGSLDEFAIWVRRLSDDELMRLYTDGIEK